MIAARCLIGEQGPTIIDILHMIQGLILSCICHGKHNDTLNIDVLTTLAGFAALASEWNDLVDQSARPLIFLTHEWQLTWWESYHPGDLWILVARDESGALTGIAPWFVMQQDEAQTICTIGCVDVTDYLDVIAPAGRELAFLNALAEFVAAEPEKTGALDLCNIPHDSATLAHLPALLRAHGYEVEIARQEVCPILQLPQTWDEYLSGCLDKKQRHELRRKLRRAETGTGWYIVGPEHDLQAELATFLRLMAASSPDKARFLENPRHVAFFEAITHKAFQQGWLQLCFLTIGGEPAATYFNFDYRNQILVYNSGQDIAQFGALSPGIVLLGHLIRHAIDHQRTEFNFLRGNETYKYQMGGQDTEIFQLKASRHETRR